MLRSPTTTGLWFLQHSKSVVALNVLRFTGPIFLNIVYLCGNISFVSYGLIF